MPHNGFHLGLEERMTMGLVAQGTELFHQQRSTVYPSDQGFHGATGSDVGTVKQSQFGLGIRANVKHKNKFWGIVFRCLKIRIFPHSTKRIIRIFYQKETKSDIKRQIGTIRDKSRHCAWARYYLCIIFSSPQSNAESHGV